MLSILRKARLKDKEMRILMLGLDNAGKTTIVKRIMNEDVNSVSPTLGFIIKTIEYEGYKLNIWDVGGQKTLRSYWRNYFEKTDALIWVVDATDRLRIQDCREELHGLLQEEGAWMIMESRGAAVEGHPDAPVADPAVQRHDRNQPERGLGLGCEGCQGETVPILKRSRHTFTVLAASQSFVPPDLCDGNLTKHVR
ncbi:ADP-ribosylation factor 4 [Apiospora phragmitis]|uniref:ADP-ribosylation factor 4 n=1 Tax=Apiospora phragmitis TaxID=2905665 RepID=A0ABR1TUV8_9PEZI